MTQRTDKRATGAQELARIQAEAQQAKKSGPPPVERWNPPFCGDLDMRIASDGTWFYLGTPIGRKRLVKLFASVLRREADGQYCLVTPVERVGIRVDDAPFLAVEMRVENPGPDQVIGFRTNVDDEVRVDGEHPLRFEAETGTGGLKPYVLVRGRLEALVARAVFYDLVALGTDEMVDGERMFGVRSAGRFYAMAPAAALAEA
jgi:uncharacterized protein